MLFLYLKGVHSIEAMTHPDPATVTQLLEKARNGNRAALDDLFPLVYDELRQRAHRQRQQWHGDYTLNTTALVHEAYLKLIDQDHIEWKNRVHFFLIAAKAMRHILLDYAKRRRRKKRGGDRQKVSFEALQEAGQEALVLTEERAEALLALEEALQRLEMISERESRIVECRFFGGMTIKETAEALGISPATVTRDWALAQAWLYKAMKETD